MTYWPPEGRSRPMMRSCGSSTAVYAAKLAGDPAHYVGGGGVGEEENICRQLHDLNLLEGIYGRTNLNGRCYIQDL